MQRTNSQIMFNETWFSDQPTSCSSQSLQGNLGGYFATTCYTSTHYNPLRSFYLHYISLPASVTWFSLQGPFWKVAITYSLTRQHCCLHGGSANVLALATLHTVWVGVLQPARVRPCCLRMASVHTQIVFACRKHLILFSFVYFASTTCTIYELK